MYRYCIVYSCDYYTCSVNRFYCARPVRFLSARRVSRLRCAINVVVFNDIHAAAVDLMSSNKRVSLTSVCVCMYITCFRNPRTRRRGGPRGGDDRTRSAEERRKSPTAIYARVMLRIEGKRKYRRKKDHRTPPA